MPRLHHIIRPLQHAHLLLHCQYRRNRPPAVQHTSAAQAAQESAGLLRQTARPDSVQSNLLKADTADANVYVNPRRQLMQQ